MGETVGWGGSRGDPVRSTGEKWEPIRFGPANDDAVDGVLKLANERIGVGRGGIEVVEIGGSLVGLASAREEARRRRHRLSGDTATEPS